MYENKKENINSLYSKNKVIRPISFSITTMRSNQRLFERNGDGILASKMGLYMQNVMQLHLNK
jgi:hypothetical protein